MTQKVIIGLPEATELAAGGPAPHNGVDTSASAAEHIEAETGHMRARIYRLIVLHGGLTCDEIETMTSLRHQTAAARLWELEGNGKLHDGSPRPRLIAKSDERRKTRSGRSARVYKAVVT